MYIGETSRSANERTSQHFKDLEHLRTKGQMLKHVAECHIDVHPTEIEFRTAIMSHHKTAFERQVKEAVLIRRNLGLRLMNSKQEYNRCYSPKIEVKKNGKDETDSHIDKENKSIAMLKDVLSI